MYLMLCLGALLFAGAPTPFLHAEPPLAFSRAPTDLAEDEECESEEAIAAGDKELEPEAVAESEEPQSSTALTTESALPERAPETAALEPEVVAQPAEPQSLTAVVEEAELPECASDTAALEPEVVAQPAEPQNLTAVVEEAELLEPSPQHPEWQAYVEQAEFPACASDTTALEPETVAQSAEPQNLTTVVEEPELSKPAPQHPEWQAYVEQAELPACAPDTPAALAIKPQPCAEDCEPPEHPEQQLYVEQAKLPECVVDPEALEREDKSLRVVCTKGLILLGSQDALLPPEELDELEGIYVENVDFPGNFEELEAALDPLYCGKALNFAKISEIKQAIVSYFNCYDRPFVHVVVPPQNVTAGVLQLVIREDRVGEIKVNGPYADTIRRTIPFEEGDALSQGKLLKNLNFLNRHPFRRVDVVAGPGKGTHAMDLDYHVQKRRGFLLTTGVDNTGIPTIGRNRFYASLTVGKPIGSFDSVLSYQYTTAYSRNKFNANTLQYTAFLQSSHILSLYGGHSSVHVNLPFPNMKNHGYSTQGSLRYTAFLDTKRMWNRSVTLGFDLKRTNNTVEFQEQLPTISRTVNLTQVMAGCEFRRSTDTTEVTLDGQLYWSPGQWLPDQSDAAFNSLRPGAVNHWVYANVSASWVHRLPSTCLLSFKLRGQATSENLLPSEQLGVGGYHSVRGYDERQLNFDTGLLLNGEFRAPAFSLFTKFRKKEIRDALQFLVFADFGCGWDRHVIPGVIARNFLASVGPGARYSMGEFLTARLDWGIKLHHNPAFGGGRSEFHFGVTGSY